MDELKKLLLALGVPEAKISLLTSDEKPEGFDATAVITEVVGEREKFYETKLTPKIEEAYEERTKGATYAATIKPIQNRLEKVLKGMGATPEELKELDAKALIDLIDARKEAAISEASKSSDDDLRKKVNDLQAKLTASGEAITKMESEHELNLKNVKTQVEQERKSEKISSGLTRILSGDRFKDIKDVGHLDRVISLYVKESGYAFELNEDGSLKPIMAKDSTDAINLSGNATYGNAEDMLYDIAQANKLFPSHNGDDDAPLSTQKVVGSDNKQYSSSVSFLKKAMGVD